MPTALVSGAGIAGPAVAYWLDRYGWDVTVIERAPALREGGSAVDFRGKQTAVLEKMGILDEVRARQTGMGEQAVVDAAGERVAGLPSAFFSGDVEIERGDLTRILYERTLDRVEYVFGDEITALTSSGDAAFRSGGTRRYDLVVGADGVHSGVRRLAFAEEAAVRTDLGLRIAGFSMPNALGLRRTGVIHSEPGRTVLLSSGRRPDQAHVSLAWRATGDIPRGTDRVQLVSDAFAGAGWRTPELLAHLPAAPDLYLDQIGQIDLPAWSAGRTVLLGDAAWGVGPGGSGTGLAMIGAYVLAGELSRGGDALTRYEKMLRPAANAGMKQARQSRNVICPPTAKAIATRDRLYRSLTRWPASAVFPWLSKRAANKPPMPAYPEPVLAR